MSTKTLIAVVLLLGVVVAVGAMAWRQRTRRIAEMERVQGIEIERAEKEREHQLARIRAITDAGPPARFYGRPDSGAGPCLCQPGDPLCACL